MMERRIAQTSLGGIGYAILEASTDEANTKAPILCFHASPRSFDEYVDAFPYLHGDAKDRTVAAFDMPGYGISENPRRSCTYDDIADSYMEVVDKALTGCIGDRPFVVVGNLMGNFIAASLASRYPGRVAALIATNLYFAPQPEAVASESTACEDAGKPVKDSWELKDDGSHLVDIHNTRKDWLPPDLNVRVVQTEITYKVNRRARYANGISIQDYDKYDFERTAKNVTCHVLCIKGEAYASFFDMIGYKGTETFDRGCAAFGVDAESATMSGPTSTLNLINQEPKAFSDMCRDFLSAHSI